jgi:hypothetical protein
VYNYEDIGYFEGESDAKISNNLDLVFDVDVLVAS